MEEPLNLTLKKMPIAIVAPFSVVENNNNQNKSSNNNNVPHVTDLNKCDDDDDAPEDLSLRKNYDQQGLDLTKNNLNRTEQLRNYLCKNDQARNFYDKNTFNDTHDDNGNKRAPSGGSDDAPCTFFNNNLDNKLLSMWYMNSIFNRPNPYFDSPTPQAYAATEHRNTSPKSNKILNNLLDKKPYNSYEFPIGFNALIRNEMPEKKIPELSSR